MTSLDPYAAAIANLNAVAAVAVGGDLNEAHELAKALAVRAALNGRPDIVVAAETTRATIAPRLPVKGSKK